MSDAIQTAPPTAPGPTTSTTSSSTSARRRFGTLRNVLNWFWRGRELKQLRRETASGSPLWQDLKQRAELLFELGQRARRPTEALPYPADPAAAELFRQSIYFAVRALASEPSTLDATETNPWQALDQPLLEKLIGSAERAPELQRLVDEGGFEELWQLSKEERALRADELARVARAALDELSWRTRARDALWIQRILRIALVLGLVLAVVGAVRWGIDRSEQARNLAVGKPWRISSTMSGVGCSSPLQECAANTDFFFHTNEEKEPWFEIDLGRPTRFSAVRVDNRRDCCFERAVPMIIEVSNDQKQYRELQRRKTSFSTWLASFAPTEGRYVRLRVPNRTVFHLSQVRVLR